MTPPLHDALQPLAGLLGRWEGAGEGDYPTIAGPFRYLETVEFGHVGKPFLRYEQRTRDPDTGAPMHAEVGYLRVADPGGDATGAGAGSAGPGIRIELVLAHPFGVTEVQEGTFADGVLALTSTSLGRTATAKAVTGLRRRFVLAADTLSYDLWMAHADTPETHHLAATLQRAS